MRGWYWLSWFVLGGAGAAPLMAQSFNFDGFVDSTVLTTQYSGATFANTIVLGAGITLNEFEFPPHSGSNVASDNGGPISIAFASPVRGIAGHFTYSVPLTIQALGSSNNVLATASSSYSDNEVLSGVAGSQANEMLTVSSSTANVYKIVIAGGAQGSSFTVDDVSLITQCNIDGKAGGVSASDVQAVINQALGASNPLSDLNGDAIVNVVDVQIVIDAAVGLNCSAS